MSFPRVNTFANWITADSIRFIWKEAAATKWWRKPEKSELGKRGRLVLPNRGDDIDTFPSVKLADHNLTAICEDNDRLGTCSLSHKGIEIGFLVASVTRLRDGSMYTPTSVLILS